MSRRRLPYNPASLSALVERVRNKYSGTPLAAIGRKLEDDLGFMLNAVRGGSPEAFAAEALGAFVERVMDLLPQSFGQRFMFDSALMQAVCEEWGQGERVGFSGMMLPGHGRKGWAYQGVPMQPEGMGHAHLVKIVHFPGEDSRNDIDLLDYAFLFHELGHDVLNRPECRFAENFAADLNRIVGRWRLRTIPDRGPTKARAKDAIDRTGSLWTPALDQRDWGHEVAVDVIGLWTGGPAYLDTFRRAIEEHEFNPYKMVAHHPPYGARAAALVGAAERVGWGMRAGKLRGIMEGWQRDGRKLGKDNAYATYADPEIVAACVGRALATCEDFVLPRCDQASLDRVAAMLREGVIPNFGMDLILAAWTVALDQDENAYSRWEGEVIPALLGCIQAVTPDTL